ncbi:protein FAM83F isoform X2 [Amia ocellicauda]|uniref:protein FAM83F isoform X2 n=1 Tax=Amia ocellicauda TaxID=2972642 RepID=UPI0034641CFC
MADSQLMCMDDDHVNQKISESKPEFYYSEEQRGAIEQLLKNGDGAFKLRIKEDNVKEFLSAREIKRIRQTFQQVQECESEGEDKSEGDPTESRSHSGVQSTYWPELSDTDVPPLDIGWPDTGFYRGVTRVAVHTHPPKDNGPHIKQVIRGLIQEAKKVIAIVMDDFTDVQIFQDLLDAALKRSVAVYMVLDAVGVSGFTDLCRCLPITAFHLRNIRVRTLEGIGLALSFGKLPGILCSKYMLVDGDKLLSGSYSFTWSASRIDRNVVTIMSGQVVEFFDSDFRELYAVSKALDLYKELRISAPSKPKATPVPVKAEPRPNHIPITSRFQADPVTVTLGNIRAPAHKYHNPKYSLVVGNTMGLTNSCQDLTTGKRIGEISPGIMQRFLQDGKALSDRVIAPSVPLPAPGVTPETEGKGGIKKKLRSTFRINLGRKTPSKDANEEAKTNSDAKHPPTHMEDTIGELKPKLNDKNIDGSSKLSGLSISSADKEGLQNHKDHRRKPKGVCTQS